MRIATVAVIGLTLAACARDDAARPAAAPTNSATATATAGREVAIVAGGCFWRMEELLRDVPGADHAEPAG